MMINYDRLFLFGSKVRKGFAILKKEKISTADLMFPHHPSEKKAVISLIFVNPKFVRGSTTAVLSFNFRLPLLPDAVSQKSAIIMLKNNPWKVG